MGDDFEPERNWRDRASIVAWKIPKSIIDEYLNIKKRYGTQLANLIIVAYNNWGSKVAKRVASKILSFNDFFEAINYLSSQIAFFDEASRKQLSALIYDLKYDYAFEDLRNNLNKLDGCDGAKNYALEIFQKLASKGYFYDTDCIFEYTKLIKRCTQQTSDSCKGTVETIKKVIK